MEIIDIIQNCIGRTLSDDVKCSLISLYEGGIDSFEMVKLIVELESYLNISLDDLLDKIETITIDMLEQRR